MLHDALRGVTRLAIDTAPVIYFIEAHPRYNALVVDVFQRIASGTCEGITSVITLGEVLVQPLRHGDTSLQRQYRDVLLGSTGFHSRPIEPQTAERAAELRARYGIRLPDALQIAVALQDGCQAFLTNDLRLKRVTNLPVLVLDELEL
jgi:predicted nucleic acid-binding protein